MRKPKDNYFMDLARQVSEQSTCPRKAVGCIIVDEYNQIKATGYNGVPRNYPHCTEIDCGGRNDTLKCKATHAEQNALLQCADVMNIQTIYTTCSPCMHCTKLIANTSCMRVVFDVKYNDTCPLSFLNSLNIETVCLNET